MKILALGDVVADYGCRYLKQKLPRLKKDEGIDFCIVNGENSADGNGITPYSADFLVRCGVDVITTGNHCFRRRESFDYYDRNDYLIRPFNFPSDAPGRGYTIIDTSKGKVAVINLGGDIKGCGFENPFKAAQKILSELENVTVKILDFHANETSEKRAMGFFLDGKVSAVFGTHTHVRTADEQILENGTGYITDLGMCGAKRSVLGVKKEIIISRYLTAMPGKFEKESSGERMINGCIFDIDTKTGKCISVKRINI